MTTQNYVSERCNKSLSIPFPILVNARGTPCSSTIEIAQKGFRDLVTKKATDS